MRRSRFSLHKRVMVYDTQGQREVGFAYLNHEGKVKMMGGVKVSRSVLQRVGVMLKNR